MPKTEVGTTEISLLRLRRLLESVKSAQPVTITARTQPRLVGVHPWRGQNLYKIALVNGIISWQYAAAVNRQRSREGRRPNFEALERAWGERLPNSPLVEYNGKFYLELKVERSISHKYVLNGKTIPAKQVEEYLGASGSTERQGLDRPIILRDYALSNILEITIDKKHYVLK